MSRSRASTAVVLLVVVLSGFAGLLFIPRTAQGATWTQTTDTDFNAGTLNGVEVVGTGTPAYVQLARDALDWTDEAPSTDPGPHEGLAMAYDSGNDVVVLFGGYDAGYLGGTWEYNPAGNAWSQTSSTGPSNRSDAGMAYDSANNVVVLFGGTSDLGYENDTWEYNSATDTWSETSPTFSPPPLGSYAMTYDSTAGRTILVGLDFVSQAMTTWAYDASANTWADRAPSTRPGPRTNHAIAYHAGLDRVVLFAGFNPFPPPGTTLGDTWEYSYVGNSWSQTVATGDGPPERFSHGLSYRDSRSSVFLFGGSPGPFSDTWRYFDIAGTRTWLNEFTQTIPPGRSMFGLTDEMSDGRSLMFGGRLAGAVTANDTWSLGPAFTGQGTLESSTFNSGGANVDWQTIAWAPTSQPAGTTLKFQVASNNDPAGPWNFVGPTGTSSSFYTSSGATIVGHDGNRYFRYRAYLSTSDVTVSPTLDELTITYDVPPASPYIVTESPRFAAVPLTAPIFVRFSEEMDVANVSWTIEPTLSVTDSWSEGNSALTLDHTEAMRECTQYTVTIAGKDLQGNSLVPGPLPNPWTFSTVCINPKINATSPSQGALDVALNAPIVVDFSEPMNKSSANWSIAPSLFLSASWSMGDTRLTLTHSTDFQQCTVHTVTITARDLAGLPLIPGDVPNPWSFTTVCTIPFIVSTSPSHLQTGVGLTELIVVTFSETMNNATVRWSIDPTLSVTAEWSNVNKTLTLNHTTALTMCKPYTVDITQGKDMDGNDLIPGRYDGYAPHPWKFQTVCPNPFLVSTVPADGDTGVDQFGNITIQFSETMNTGSVTWTISSGITLYGTWIAGSMDTLLRLNHSEPFACGPNTVDVFGNDLADGLPLVPGLAPKPWTFTPSCPNPFLVATSPADGDIDVPLDQSIVVTFSETMDTLNTTWTIFPDIAVSASWSDNNTVLTLNHTDTFQELREYSVFVDGQDVDGNPLIPGPAPNPWRFTTAAVQPYIVSTDPPNGASNVPTTASVTVEFSEPMNTTTVRVTSVPPLTFLYFWSNNNATLVLVPTSLFVECDTYTLTAAGNDTQGRPLGPGPVPNPWSFSIVCTRPYIVSTSPSAGATEVPNDAPIVVTFSEPMDQPSVRWSISPSLGLSDSWSGNTLTLTHATPFDQCKAYTVTISGNDTEGNPLTSGPAPNPWTFTSFTCNAPFILSTDPSAGETGVLTTASIIVNFNAPMNTGTVTRSFVPPVATNPIWSNGNRTLTLVPSMALLECQDYTVTIGGQGENGIGLGPGPVPNPWTFTTVCPAAPPGGLRLTRVVPNTVRLTWTAAPNADSYRVYESQNRFAPWPWAVLGTTAGIAFDAPHLNDGLTHYYIVRSIRAGAESSNSTMGAKVQLAIGFNPSGANTYWLSLPYRAGYATASDISTDLTSTRINVVGKWDPVRQTSILWYLFRGVWRGTNFAINPGDGLWIGSVSAFSWPIVGTDRFTALTFTFNPTGNNVNWISLPYTSTYGKASDLVLDIEGSLGPGANTKIVEVAKWDGASQSLMTYYWTTSGWTGSDFTIASGEAVYLRVVSTFVWQPKLITPEVP